MSPRLNDVGGPYLLGMMKNERPYILEWVAHHLVLGFQRVLIVSNDNTDGSDTVLGALAEAGVVDCITHSVREGITPRRQASALATEHLRARNYEGFVAHFDADEFLLLHQDDTVGSFLRRFNPGSSVCINWKIFGSNGHKRRPEGLVMQNFNRCAPDDFPAHHDYKTISWFSDSLLEFDGHSAIFARGHVPRSVFADGSVFEVEDSAAPYSPAKKVVFDVACLNHYIVKSGEEYRDKIRRGRIVSDPGKVDRKARYTKAFFPRFDRNECVGNVSASHIMAVQAMMEDIYKKSSLHTEFSRVQVGLPRQ